MIMRYPVPNLWTHDEWHLFKHLTQQRDTEAMHAAIKGTLGFAMELLAPFMVATPIWCISQTASQLPVFVLCKLKLLLSNEHKKKWFAASTGIS